MCGDTSSGGAAPPHGAANPARLGLLISAKAGAEGMALERGCSDMQGGRA